MGNEDTMGEDIDGLTVRMAQTSVNARIEALGGYWPPLANLARLFEECGELARAVNQRTGPKALKAGELPASAADELGDVLFTALVLANSLGVDAESALSGALAKTQARATQRNEATPGSATVSATSTPEPQPVEHQEHDRLNDRSDYQLCFACGARNGSGLGLIFHQEGDDVVTEFIADERYQGFPGVIHGGIVATVLDETLERIGTLQGRWLMTGRLEVRYRRAAPINRRLRVAARVASSRGRALIATAWLSLAGEPTAVIAEAQGTFLPLSPAIQAHVATAYPAFAHAFDNPSHAS